jgi:putative PIN family toxin of toxin-antitoxin system
MPRCALFASVVVRVVFDTVGFVRGLINPSSRWGRLLFDYADRYDLIVSQPLIVELVEVLGRPEVSRLFRSLPGRDPAAILALLQRAETVPVDEGEHRYESLRDEGDKHVLATAIAARADYLVTEDRDLLDLRSYAGITICTGAAFIATLEE